MKRNNKGYTLVELVVAVAVLLVVLAEVGALMVNSQHLYRNGYYELNMQENAQQVIQQVQELMMNCAGKSPDGTFQGSITRNEYTTDGIPSDVITITTRVRKYEQATGLPTDVFEDTTYVIGREVDLVPGTPYLGKNPGANGTDMRYSTLWLYTTAGGSTVKMPMAEGVRAIHLRTNDVTDAGVTKTIITNYTTADLVTLSVEMQNQQYSYTASGETYLRNQPGTGGPSVDPDGGSSGADVDLNVLRIHQYNLKNYVPKEYVHFESDSSNGSDFSTNYTLTDAGSLTCSNGLNAHSNWSKPRYEAIIWACKDDGHGNAITDRSQCKKILIHTVPVVQGIKLPVYGPDRSDPFVNCFPVEGICVCPSCLASRSIECQITLDEIKSAGTNNFDLAVFNSISTGHNIKNDAGNNMKAPDNSGVDVVGNWLNKTYLSASVNSSADLVFDPRLRLQFTGYSGSGPYGNNTELGNNYSSKGNFDLIDANSKYITDLTFTSVNSGTANCLALRTGHSNGSTWSFDQVQEASSKTFWANVVDEYHGYIRIQMTVTFKNRPTGDTYTCYGYVFPKEWATSDQAQALWDMMKNTNRNYDGSGPYPTPNP